MITASDYGALAIVVLGVVCGLAVAVFAVSRQRLLVGAVWWAATQNLVVPLLWRLHVLNHRTAIACLTLSECLCALCVIQALLQCLKDRVFRIGAVDYLFACFSWIVLLRVGFSAPHVPVLVRLQAARPLLTPVLYYAAGRTVAWSRSLLSAMVLPSVVAAVAGCVSFLMFGNHVWDWLQIGRYWIDVKGMPASFLQNGLPGNFFSHTGPRMATTYGDPLATGYALAIGTGFLLVTRWRQRPIWMLAVMCGAAAIALSGTRAGIVILGAALVTVGFTDSSRWVRRASWLAVVGAIGVMFKKLAASISGQSGSLAMHLVELRSNFLHVPWLIGTGVGTAGAWSGTYAAISGVGDSAFFETLAQVGVAGAALFTAATLVIVVTNIRRRTVVNKVLGALMLASLASAFISAQLLSDTSCALLWIGAGTLMASGTDGPERRREWA